MRSALFLVASILPAYVYSEVCYLPLDVMFLQDTTGSFDDDLPNVVRQIPDMVNSILAEHPHSYFGVAEFKDKPFFPLGEIVDFCYKLGDGKLSGNLADFEWAYSLLYASGGADLPEAQYQALINVALDNNVGWRPLPSTLGDSATEGESGARLVIMSTDAVPHLPNATLQYSKEQFPDLPRDWPPNSGIIRTGDPDFECFHEDYPSPYQAAAALQEKRIHVVILTPNDPAIVPAWTWVNEQLLGQSSGYYQFIKEDSSDVLDKVLKALQSITEVACPPAPSSTEAQAPMGTLPPLGTNPNDVGVTLHPLTPLTTKNLMTTQTAPSSHTTSSEGFSPPAESPPATSLLATQSEGYTSIMDTIDYTSRTETELTSSEALSKEVAYPYTSASISPHTTMVQDLSTEGTPVDICSPCPCPPEHRECPAKKCCNEGVIIKISDRPKRVIFNMQS